MKQTDKGFDLDLFPPEILKWCMPQELRLDGIWWNELPKTKPPWHVRAQNALAENKLHLLHSMGIFIRPTEKHSGEESELLRELRTCTGRINAYGTHFQTTSTDLWDWYDHLFLHLYTLIPRLQLGDKDAAKMLVQFASDAIRLVEETVEINPTLAEELAESRLFWPSFASKYATENSTAPLEHLGKRFKFVYDNNSRWNPRDPLIRVAAQLLFLTDQYRSSLQRHISAKVCAIEELHPDARRAYLLEEFNGSTVKLWWEVARRIFLELCDEPHRNKTLLKHVRIPKSLSAGRAKSRIITRIYSRFKTLAGGH